MNNLMSNAFVKIEPGLCRLTMDNKIAIKTENGYKAYDVSDKTLINCDTFVLDIGDDYFFVIPTTTVNINDIILVNNIPRVVIDKTDDKLIAINYLTSVKEELVPESHIFLGKTYLYAKIVSMFALMNGNAENNMMQYMLMSQVMSNQNFNSILPMMMFANGGQMFNNLFGIMNNAKEEKHE